jgi:hypothetical protein
VTTIHPRSSILSALQARIGEAQRPGSARAPSRTARTHAAQFAATSPARRISALDPADPDRRRKAVRVVLELELARTFGASLLNDPAFPGLLDAVQAQMQADAQTASAVHALGDLLLAGA